MAGLVPAIGFSADSSVSGDCVRDVARPLRRQVKEGAVGAVVRLPWRASLSDPSSLRDELAHHIGFESLDAAFVAVA
jgi:hypothetical protein